jgi:hypothetical protein
VIIPGPADHLTVFARRLWHSVLRALSITLRPASPAISTIVLGHRASILPVISFVPASCAGSFVRTFRFLPMPIPFVTWRVRSVLTNYLVIIAHPA